MNKLLIKLILWMFIITFLGFLLENIIGVDFNAVQNWVKSFGIFAPLAYSFLLYLGLTIPFNPLPDSALLVFAAFTFPPYFSIPATFLAQVLAICTNYYLGRKFGWKIIEKITSEEDLNSIKQLTKKISLRLIILIRFVPSATAIGFDVLSYAAALTQIPFKKLFWASIIPWTILNILFFISTYALKEISSYLFFIPALAIIGIPVLVIYLAKKQLP